MCTQRPKGTFVLAHAHSALSPMAGHTLFGLPAPGDPLGWVWVAPMGLSRGGAGAGVLERRARLANSGLRHYPASSAVRTFAAFFDVRVSASSRAQSGRGARSGVRASASTLSTAGRAAMARAASSSPTWL